MTNGESNWLHTITPDHGETPQQHSSCELEYDGGSLSSEQQDVIRKSNRPLKKRVLWEYEGRSIPQSPLRPRALRPRQKRDDISSPSFSPMIRRAGRPPKKRFVHIVDESHDMTVVSREGVHTLTYSQRLPADEDDILSLFSDLDVMATHSDLQTPLPLSTSQMSTSSFHNQADSFLGGVASLPLIDFDCPKKFENISNFQFHSTESAGSIYQLDHEHSDVNKVSFRPLLSQFQVPERY